MPLSVTDTVRSEMENGRGKYGTRMPLSDSIDHMIEVPDTTRSNDWNRHRV
jgi:hypothetical protein